MGYVFRDIVPVRNAKNLDADKVGAIVEALPKGEETETLVKDARSAKHYLHACFDWNDKSAAHAHRIQTARSIIRCVEYVPDDKPDATPIPAFVSIATGKEGGKREYFTPPQIMDNQALQLRLMQSAKVDLLAWLRRYNALRAISPLVEGVVTRLDAEIAAAIEASKKPDAA